VKTDNHGNVRATEGVTRCACGAKYWENDRCVSCGAVAPTVCAECATALHPGTHALTGEPEWHDDDDLGSSESPTFHDHEPATGA
jgi:hypothetical protein